jgi:hydroperoxide dehydratase
MASASALISSEDIPGTYGLRIAGAMKDRYDYFVKEGPENFFKNRMIKYKSTVYRVNLPPGPPLFPETQAIVLLDSKSFGVLFDMSKVEKRNVLIGNYIPSKNFTGGLRMLAYMDPSEDHHAELKKFCLEVIKKNSDKWFPEFDKASKELWTGVEKDFSTDGKASFNAHSEHMLFNFLCRCMVDRNPSETELRNDGPSCVKKWLALQLAPIASSGVLPKILEEVTIHAAPLPPFLVSKNYQRLHDFFDATEVLNTDQNLSVDKKEACHNLLFMVCFNAFGGLMILFPSIIKRIVQVGGQLQRNLAEEVRGAVCATNGSLDAQALKSMRLVRSTVYEVLRMDPPIPFQYARAKEDFVLESHDARYQVKKGEILAGYQPMAMRDPLVFEDAQQFTPDRFMHDEDKGQNLLQYLFWSNGPETDEPSVHNKQCPGKNIVVILACLFVAHIYLRYDSIDIDQNASSSRIVFTALNKATF